MEYTRPQSSPLSAPMSNPVETTRAVHTPPSSVGNFKPCPPFLPVQGPSANTPGFFPASPPASPGPPVDSLRGSSTLLVTTPQQISWRADVAFIRNNATIVDHASSPRCYSLSDIEAAETLLMLYHGRPAPPWDLEETESEEELAAKQLMDIHAADKELGVASKSQSGSVSQKRRRRRTEPAVVTGPVKTRSGREVKRRDLFGT